MESLKIIAWHLINKEYSFYKEYLDFHCEEDDEGNEDWDAPLHKKWLNKSKDFANENPDSVDKVVELIKEKWEVTLKIKVLLKGFSYE